MLLCNLIKVFENIEYSIFKLSIFKQGVQFLSEIKLFSGILAPSLIALSQSKVNNDKSDNISRAP